MASDKLITWVERLVWILIYGGLLGLIVGIASLSASPVTAWSLMVVGSLIAAAGVVLIWVRSRLNPPR
ncbi:MAG TPA: hypothetical protein VLI46_02550 [Ramlibacter sp.]|nr:hypothetical protein [Ramlibacter sp.]